MIVGILVFDDVEELDFVGPWEILSCLNKIRPGSLEVLLVGTSSPVRAFNGLRILPDLSIGDCPQLDVLVVPGGSGRKEQARNENTLDFVRRQYPGLSFLASVCTGSFILTQAGLLQGRAATTHRSALDELRDYGGIHVVQERLTRSGNVICAAGVAAAMDMALHLVEELSGPGAAKKVAEHIEYPYRRTVPFGAGG